MKVIKKYGEDWIIIILDLKNLIESTNGRDV